MPGEDAYRALGIAAVMEKAGCPIPAEMQQMVDRAWEVVDGLSFW